MIESHEGIEYRRMPSPEGKRLQHLARRLGLRAEDSPDRAVHYVYALAVALDARRRGVDVIHVHNFSQFVPVLRLVNPRARIVLHMHCEWLSQIDAARAQNRIARADRVLGCSQYIVRLAQQRFPDFASRMGVLYNGADLTAFGEHPDAPPANVPARGRGGRALFVGRVSPEKGVHDLLDAFERVLDRLPDARLTVVGPPWTTPRHYLVDLSDDPQVQALRTFYGDDDYVAQLRMRMTRRLSEAVDFIGQVARHELPAQYRAADVLVNPSLSESFGMSIVEAHASGRPVVATRVGGMPELVRHGENGFLVPAANPGELGDALAALLEDADLRQRFGQAGKADATRRFAWERIAEDALVHYREVVEQA